MLTDYPIFLEMYLYPDPCRSGTGFLFRDDKNKEWLITARHNLYPVPDYINKFPADRG
jgi:hypothetical protein